MLKELKKEAALTHTENGAAAYSTTNSDCLDLFATVGALRLANENQINTLFMRAFAEDPNKALKILFFARDAREGLGERRVFRTALRYLASVKPESVVKNLESIAAFGRFDDLLSLLGTPCENETVEYIKSVLESDLASLEKGEAVSLLAKWLPSVNTSSPEAVKTAKHLTRKLSLNEKEYRKTLSRLRAKIKIIENNLREKDYSFNYESVPGKAMLKYRTAFYRNDRERYTDYLSAVNAGCAKMNTSVLTPYDIVGKCFERTVAAEERRTLDTLWRNLPEGVCNGNSIVVADGSGSMYTSTAPMPAAIAQSLAIYFAERNGGAFKNHFITFSESHALVEIKGADIYEKVHYCASFNEVANTNIEKVFKLILDTAKKNSLPQSELPETVYIISDMEFDLCAEGANVTNFKNAKKMFKQAGYTLPNLVFWNVCSRHRTLPVTENEQGVCLVSGSSQKIFDMVKSGMLEPYSFMCEIIESERYAKISA